MLFKAQKLFRFFLKNSWILFFAFSSKEILSLKKSFQEKQERPSVFFAHWTFPFLTEINKDSSKVGLVILNFETLSIHQNSNLY